MESITRSDLSQVVVVNDSHSYFIVLLCDSGVIVNVFTAAGGSGGAPIGSDQRQSGEGVGGGEGNEYLDVSGDQLGMLVHTI